MQRPKAQDSRSTRSGKHANRRMVALLDEAPCAFTEARHLYRRPTKPSASRDGAPDQSSSESRALGCNSGGRGGVPVAVTRQVHAACRPWADAEAEAYRRASY